MRKFATTIAALGALFLMSGSAHADNVKLPGIHGYPIIIRAEAGSPGDAVYMCDATRGRWIEIRLSDGSVDVTHMVEGKRIKFPRMAVMHGEDELRWEGHLDGGITLRGVLSGEDINDYTESLHRDGKLLSKIVTGCLTTKR
jgi:hypothetical protein